MSERQSILLGMTSEEFDAFLEEEEFEAFWQQLSKSHKIVCGLLFVLSTVLMWLNIFNVIYIHWFWVWLPFWVAVFCVITETLRLYQRKTDGAQ